MGHFISRTHSDELDLRIAPDEGEFSMEWARDGRRVAAFHLKMVVAWDIETIGQHEYLRLGVDISPSTHCSVRHFLLRVYPTVEAEWVMDWGPARGGANIRS